MTALELRPGEISKPFVVGDTKFVVRSNGSVIVKRAGNSRLTGIKQARRMYRRLLEAQAIQDACFDAGVGYGG